MGYNHDEKEYIQSENIDKHKKIAEQLLKKVLPINVIVQKKKLKNKKKSLKKLDYILFIIENGEILKILKFLKI